MHKKVCVMGEGINMKYGILNFKAFLNRVSSVRISFGPLTILFDVSLHVT